jgi:hypothetical protein
MPVPLLFSPMAQHVVDVEHATPARLCPESLLAEAGFRLVMSLTRAVSTSPETMLHHKH